MSESEDSSRYPISCERLSPSTVKIICTVDGNSQEIIARVATEGYYDTCVGGEVEPTDERERH